MRGLKLLLLVCLFLVSQVSFAEDFYYKTNYYGNGFIGGEFTFNNGTINVKNELSTVTCPDADCINRFTFGGALTWLPDNTIVDVSVTGKFQLPQAYKIHCMKIIEQSGGGLVVDSRRQLSIPPKWGFAGFPFIDMRPMDDMVINTLKFIGRLPNSQNVALRTVPFNASTCKPAGPPKDLLTFPDAQLNTVIGYYGQTAGVVLKEVAEDIIDLIFLTPEVSTARISAPPGTWVASASVAGVEGSPSRMSSAKAAATQKWFLLYKLVRQRGNGFEAGLFMQVLEVDGASIEPVGKAKVIAPFAITQQPNAERFASVAFEPNARFALYTAYSPTCGKQIVKSQRFNPNTGSKIGPPKVLLDCNAFANSIVGAFGLDLASTGESPTFADR